MRSLEELRVVSEANNVFKESVEVEIVYDESGCVIAVIDAVRHKVREPLTMVMKDANYRQEDND